MSTPVVTFKTIEKVADTKINFLLLLNFVPMPLGKDGHKRLEDNETQRFPSCGRRPRIGECVFVYINHLAQ